MNQVEVMERALAAAAAGNYEGATYWSDRLEHRLVPVYFQAVKAIRECWAAAGWAVRG
jgi:hypothetical protein